MFKRKVEKDLLDWKNKKNRKPLVLRGARQTGKTTLIRKFAENFDNFIELNLEKDSIRKIFSEVRDIKDIIKTIEAVINQRVIPGKTLFFIDEIQNSISAIKLLRYFYEELPDLHVISAGSLLEVRMRTEGWSFPVGRVEFLYLYPVTFDEFLAASNENIILESLNSYNINKIVPIPEHDKLIDLLTDYMCIGGMPEAVNEYITNKNFISVRKYHENLIASFKEDFTKYSKSSEVEYLKLVWDRVPFEIGTRIKYSKLSKNNALSRNISNAFDILHEAMLVERILPTTSTKLPLIKKRKSAPKAMFIDIGLCTHIAGLTRNQIKDKFTNPIFSGALFEQFVSQELLALNFYNRNPLYFWIREEKGTSAELDFLIPTDNKLVPIEVKSGSHGSLKSLHQYLNKSKTSLGVRIYNGPLQINNHTVTLSGVSNENTQYKLLSLPFYLLFRLPELTDHLNSTNSEKQDLL